MQDGERSLAVFIDFENLALGFQGRRDRFDIERVLERLVEKGKIVAKKAYADWSRFGPYTAPLHEAAIELVEIPRRGQTGKNSADIRLCVDAMDLAYSKEHIDTFVIVSGDSDFSPLVSKLKENGKHVIGLGMQESTSDLLRDNCDEFIYYEDLGKAPPLAPDVSTNLPENKRKAFELLMESLLALRRENKEALWASMIKDTMKRKKPSFNEAYHGYRTFSELLEDAQKEGLLELETDKRSRTYVVTRFGAEMNAPAPAAPAAKKKGRRRRSSKKTKVAARGNGEHRERPAATAAPPGTPAAEELFDERAEEASSPPPHEAFAHLEDEEERGRERVEPVPAAEGEEPEDEPDDRGPPPKREAPAAEAPATEDEAPEARRPPARSPETPAPEEPAAEPPRPQPRRGRGRSAKSDRSEGRSRSSRREADSHPYDNQYDIDE
jgi:uncharacterized protein (TIGR00288 family)